jgi:microcystin-dependent protein
MASVNLSPLFNGTTSFGPTGTILAGGQLFTYQAGSSTPLATYTTSSGTVANANPIILGSDGKLPNELWLQYGYAYKFVLEDANSNLIDTYDNIAGIITSIPATSPAVPSGCILLWSGSVGSIPSGFVLCNGSNSTPDLRDKFIVGAGNTYTVGQTGGSTTATITQANLPNVNFTATSVVTDPGHFHGVPGTNTAAGTPSGNFSAFNSSGVTQNTNTAVTGITVATTVNSGGSNTALAILPPYYALCYIYKS